MRLAVLPLVVSAACATGEGAQALRYRLDRTVRAPAARVDVHYAELGPELGPTPAVYLHPWGADLEIWREVMPALAAERRSVLVDLPGHGASGTTPGRYPPRRLAQAVLGALDDAKIGRAIFVGNSIGGATALAIAELAPERVAGLVLVGAPGGEPVPALLRRGAATALQPRALATVSPPLLELMWAGVAGARSPALARLGERAVAAREAPEWKARAPLLSSAILEVIDYAPKLEAITAPALVVQGDDDRVVWTRGGRALADRIAGARLAVLEGCGHFVEAECPERFVELVRPFLAELDARR